MLYLRFLGITIILAFISSCAQTIHDYEPLALEDVIETVNENHVSPMKVDTRLDDIIGTFIQRIDPEKRIFLKTDVQRLKSNYKRSNNDFEHRSRSLINETYDLLKKGTRRAEKYAQNKAGSSLEIDKDEYLETDDEKIEFAKKGNLKTRWKLHYKKQLIETLYEVEMTDPQLSIREKTRMASNLTKSFFNGYFHELNSKTKEDLVESFMKAFVSSNDSQSTYLSLKSKEEWDNEITRSYVGIGVRIKTTPSYPVITDVFHNGPSWKNGKIKIEDRILKVTNQNNQPVDIAGFSKDNVVDLLRGKNGSEVTIQVKHPDNQIEDIRVTRGKVELSKAVSVVLEAPNKKTKVGYIHLPRFYSGQEGSSSHILKEINNLNAAKVDGIILDLRNNRGGRAGEARGIIGHFLKGGLIMQVVDSDGYKEKFNDEDKNAAFSGELIVLVNEESASASELLAGTLQDYGRAVIVGNQTYGKGTAQNFFEVINKEDSTKFGYLKLTYASFYTGHGRSVQYHGVTPDITLSSMNMHQETGTRKLKNQLKFKDLKPSVSKSKEEHENVINQLQSLSTSRQSSNEYFRKIEEIAQLTQQTNENTLINLNYQVFKQEKEVVKKAKMELLDMKEHLDAKEQIRISASTTNFERLDFWKSKIEKDIYINEAMLIMNDMLGT